MDAYSVYRDIQKRTKGQFLIGVVGLYGRESPP